MSSVVGRVLNRTRCGQDVLRHGAASSGSGISCSSISGPQTSQRRWIPTTLLPGGRKRMFGFSKPFKRAIDKVPRLPAIKPRWYDFKPAINSNGMMILQAPYPPKINRTIQCLPEGFSNEWPTKQHKTYPLKWRGVEYQYTPMIKRKPHGGDAWGGQIIRIGSKEEIKKAQKKHNKVDKKDGAVNPFLKSTNFETAGEITNRLNTYKRRPRGTVEDPDDDTVYARGPKKPDVTNDLIDIEADRHAAKAREERKQRKKPVTQKQPDNADQGSGWFSNIFKPLTSRIGLAKAK